MSGSGGDSLAVKAPEPVTPLALETPTTSAPPPPRPAGGAQLGRSEMSFSASGTMNFNMDFKVGDKVACLNVNGDEGLSCSMDDYRVVIKEGQGFILEMPGGAKVTIPVNKKKVG